VFFVSALDLYNGFDTKPDLGDRDHIDLLGVYYSCHPKYGRTIIQVSPEKVFDASMRLKNRPEVDLPLKDIYQAMIIGVVIHEIGHWLMDERQSYPDHRMSWKWLADLYVGEQSRLEDYVQEMLRRPFPGCDYKPGDQHRRQSKVIEESLAEALMLKQDWGAPVLMVLESFVRNSPAEYAAGLNWKLQTSDLLMAMVSWRAHKKEINYNRWFGTLLPIDGSPLDLISKSLLASEHINSPPEFQCDFVRFVEKELPVMMATWQKDIPKYDDHLNETFGVFCWLCTQAWWKKCGLGVNQLNVWLTQWSQTGKLGKGRSDDFRMLHQC
jgi:hypothetical protein